MGDELCRFRCSGSDRGTGSFKEGEETPGSKGSKKKKKKPCNLIKSDSEVQSKGN